MQYNALLFLYRSALNPKMRLCLVETFDGLYNTVNSPYVQKSYRNPFSSQEFITHDIDKTYFLRIVIIIKRNKIPGLTKHLLQQ